MVADKQPPFYVDNVIKHLNQQCYPVLPVGCSHLSDFKKIDIHKKVLIQTATAHTLPVMRALL